MHLCPTLTLVAGGMRHAGLWILSLLSLTGHDFPIKIQGPLSKPMPSRRVACDVVEYTDFNMLLILDGLLVGNLLTAL